MIALPNRRNPFLPAAAIVVLGALLTAQSGWTLRSTVGPSAREQHGVAFDIFRGVTVLFGGFDSQLLADTWEWNGQQWTQRATAITPPVRYFHALAFDLPRGCVMLFGGGDGIVELSDTWTYDGVNWARALPAHQPSARLAATLAYDVASSGVILFGGCVGGAQMVFADTWLWNGSDWTQLAPTNSPPARWSHAMATDFARARIVMFGGNDNAGSGYALFGDTWEWNGTDWAQRFGAPAPPAASHAAMVWDAARDVAVHFGGWIQGSVSGQTWLFDGAVWRSDPRVTAPSPRHNHSIAYDLLRNRAVLFGGQAGGNRVADTWEYAPGVIARWAPIGNGCAGTVGVPVLRPAAGSLPILGATFRLDTVGAPANGIVLVAVGFSDQQWGSFTLPLGLASFGMPGCTLHVSPDFSFLAPILGGSATLAIPLPNLAGLAGTRFFAQALVADPGVNALGAVVSNAGAALVAPF